MTTVSATQETPFVKRPSFIFALSALTALTATAIDVALPAQPMIATGFGERAAKGGLIVSAYFIGFGPGQLIWGPLADKYGRMKPIMFGLAGFILTTILCIFSTSLEMLTIARVLQGVFGGSTPVIARAIARDQGGGKDTANLMATILMIFGLAPLLAPIIGSGILLFTDWTGTFWFLVIFAIVLMFIAQMYIAPATVAHAAKNTKRVPLSWGLLKRLFSERDFVMGSFSLAALFAGYSTILAVGATMVDSKYGVPVTKFGFLFAIAAAAVIIGPAISKRILKYRSVRTPLKIGASLCGIAGCAFLLMANADVPLVVYWGFVFLYVLGYGMLGPMANAIALEPAGESAGTASSILSAIPTTGGVLGAGLATSTLFATTYEAVSYTMAGGGIIACVIILTLGGGKKTEE